MSSMRIFLPLLFALSLLCAQQAGAAHAVHHALEQSQQKGKHSSHSTVCEKCENYAQLGSALNVGSYLPPLLPANPEAAVSFAATFHTIHTLAAIARGPPLFLQKTA
jgi:hypothetical protein